MSNIYIEQHPQDYQNRVYAGWLGKLIGVRLGAPVEGWTYEHIQGVLGEIRTYLPLPPHTVFKPDDDTAFPMILIRALADEGPPLTPTKVAQAWLNYLGDERGTLWWGGYGVSTEHTAYINLKSGIPPVLSGSTQLNGRALAEQIGGQIFSDIWGLIAPADPMRAAHMAEIAARVSHDGEALYGARYIAALVSLAFVESHPETLVAKGLAYIPEHSEYARVVRAVQMFYQQYPDNWRAAFHLLAQNFGYERYPGKVPIIPNAGVVVLALLYSEGNFSKGVQVATMCGWDTDCNAGNVGTIMGVAVGLEGIDEETWRYPLNDEFIAASLVGACNIWDVPAAVDLFIHQGYSLAGKKPPPPRPRYHFTYPGSTHGFRAKVAGNGAIVDVRNRNNALSVVVRKLKKQGEVKAFVRTYYRAGELASNYYGASFSPKIYPGQRIWARVRVPKEASPLLRAGLYVWDDNAGQAHYSPATPLSPGDWIDLEYPLPEMHGVCLSEVGVYLRNVGGEPWTGTLDIDVLDWNGVPHFAYDFAREQSEYGAISQWTVLRGYWRLEDGAYHGSGVGINETYSGAPEWENYAFTVRLVPLLGEYHNVNVRVQGALRSYAAGLAPGRLVLYKNQGKYMPVASIAFTWEYGRAYEFTITVWRNRLTLSVGGRPLLTWEDHDNPYLRGQIGFSNFAGCHTRYEKATIKGVDDIATET